MKKIISLSFCIALYSAIAQAQTLIPKFGISLSAISASDDITGGEDVKDKLGIVGGLGCEFTLSKKIALQPELLFHQKGWKSSSTSQNSTSENTITLNYLEVPVLVKVKFGSFYVNAGPSVALGLGGKYKSKISGVFGGSADGKIKFGTPPINDTSDDLYVDNSIDVGAQIGCGYVIANLIMIDLRYGLGLTNILNKDETNKIDDNKSKLRSFQVTVGVPIRLGKK